MVIGICDDDRIWLRRTQQLLEQYMNENQTEGEIHIFSDSAELFAYTGLPLDVLFLDIELQHESGMEVARQINVKWEPCQIVYLTNYLNYAVDVYQTEHVYYVLKEQFAERLNQIFSKVEHGLRLKRKSLSFQCIGGKIVSLAPDEIYYFERRGRRTLIESVWGSYEIRDRIEEVLRKLPRPDFIRCHASYIVGMANVREIEKDIFHMKNGAAVIVSRGYMKSTKAEVAAWMRAQLL